MPVLKKAIAASYLKPLFDYLEQQTAVNVEALLLKHDIKRAKLESSRYFLNSKQYVDLMTDILPHVDSQALIKAIASNLDITEHGLLGLLSLCSFSLRQVIKMVLRFYRLRGHLVDLSFIEDDQQAIIRFTPAFDFGVAHDFTIEMSLAVIQHAKQQIMQNSLSDDQVFVQHEKPSHYQVENDFFAGHLQYGAADNALIFPRTLLDHKLKNTHQPTFEMLHKQAEDMLLHMDSVSVVDKVKQILANWQGAFPSLEVMSDKLATSSRTLSRKLKAAETSYQKLLDEERVARAKQLLLQTDFSVTEIAMHLYFTDASHMTKLFKQYVQQTPAEFRKKSQL